MAKLLNLNKYLKAKCYLEKPLIHNSRSSNMEKTSDSFKMVSFESVAMEASLHKVNKILRVSGLQIEYNESNSNMAAKLSKRKLFCFLTCMLYCELLGEIAWMVKSITEGKFLEATNCAPCAILCVMGSVKTYYRLKYAHHINGLINGLRQLQSDYFNPGIRGNLIAYAEVDNIVRKLHLAINILTVVNVTGLFAFFLGPLAIMAFIYHETGKVELRLPFLILYPFNAYDIRVYPFIYARHVLAGTFAVFTVLGPDCLYYTFCTYVQVQFRMLYHDFESILTPSVKLGLHNGKGKLREQIKAYIMRHKKLIRCCNLIETIYTKSTLLNFISSSLLLCMAGFNVMAYEDLAMFSNFLSFLLICLVQIYLICDYGDSLSRASMDLSSTVYNQWYNVDVKTAKDLLIIMTRAQKACKLTAYTFTEINMGAFTRILSTSWSYFALLRSVYNRGGEH